MISLDHPQIVGQCNPFHGLDVEFQRTVYRHETKHEIGRQKGGKINLSRTRFHAAASAIYQRNDADPGGLAAKETAHYHLPPRLSKHEGVCFPEEDGNGRGAEPAARVPLPPHGRGAAGALPLPEGGAAAAARAHHRRGRSLQVRSVGSAGCVASLLCFPRPPATLLLLSIR
jgi:hypothetical protein